MEFNQEDFKKDWYNGVKIKDMAVTYGKSNGLISRIATKVLKLKPRRSTADEDKIARIAEYYKTHTVLETTKHFKVAKITVQRAAATHKVFKITEANRKLRKERAIKNEVEQVRVLSSVPEGFKIPSRVVRW